jgi:hypothetical protein
MHEFTFHAGRVMTSRGGGRLIARAGIPVVLGLAVACGGCGTYTKSDFIARADAICANALRDTRAIALRSSPGAASSRLNALAGYLAAALPVVESEASQLRAVRRPPDNPRDRALLARYLAAVRADADSYRQLANAARTNDAAGVATAEAALRASPVSTLAARYGLHSCGTPGATVR